MNERDLVVELLKTIPTRRCCDACLSRRTGIRPPRQVNQLCRRLVELGKLVREKGKCPLGNHTRVLNALTAKRSARTKSAVSPGSPGSAGLGIEEAWRYVDRFCRALWNTHLDTGSPASLAEAITALRDEQIVPAHEANMMHTIRSLRNMVVHEDVDFGDHETAIARAAWEIIRAWGERDERALWRATMTMCAGHA